MAILNRRALLGGAGSALTIMAAPAIGKGKTVLVQRTTDSYPRCIRMPNGRWSGFEVEISRDMCKLADVGFTAAEEYFPWSRSLRMIESGELQLLPAVSYREERNLYMDYIGVYDIEEIVVVVHKENAGVRFDTLDDFTKPGQIFERVETAVFTPEFDERIRTDPSFSSHFIGTVGSGSGDRFELLNALGTRVYRGRVFGALTDWYSFAAVQNLPRGVRGDRFDPDDLVAIRAGVFGTPPTWLAASRTVPLEVRDRLRDAYVTLRRDGTFSRRWRRWFGDRAEPPFEVRQG